LYRLDQICRVLLTQIQFQFSKLVMLTEI